MTPAGPAAPSLPERAPRPDGVVDDTPVTVADGRFNEVSGREPGRVTRQVRA
jgi:hypothetical protein